ncbi:MAG: ATP-binding protein [Candidatus Kapaibacterium sp.]
MFVNESLISDYIESLGVALQLESSPITNEIAPAIGQELLMNESSCTTQDVMLSFKTQIYHQFAIHDGAIYFVNNQNDLQPASALEYSSELFITSKKLEQDGCVRKALVSDETLVIPNKHVSSFDCNEYIIIIPMLLRTGIKAVFIGKSHGVIEAFTKDVLQLLKSITETTAITLDTIRTSEEIEALSTHVKVLNEQMAHSSKLASIGELTASVAHEINNPLQIMSAHIQLLEHGLGNNERRLEILKEQCSRIANITRKLLDFSRSVPFENLAEPVNLYEVIDSVLQFVTVQLEHDSIKLKTYFDTTLVKVNGVRSQLEQVLLNILLNARDAMFGGGTLTVGLLSSESHATIVVTDNGNGMQPEVVAKIFEPRFTTKPKGKGSGYGLYISRTIIEQHEGSISVVSEVGKGTTFKISLPLLPPQGTTHRLSRLHRK